MTERAATASRVRFALPRLRTVHKVCALIALAWLTVLGLTGWILDHHAWRWTHQATVPSRWTSPAINRLVRGTIMRSLVAAEGGGWLGGSERGLWRTTDGAAWRPVPWTETDGSATGATPQVYALVPDSAAPDAVWIATDDGVWRVRASDGPAQPAGLRGLRITALTPGAAPGTLVGLADDSRIFAWTPQGAPTWTDLADVAVDGLPERVGLFRFALDLHVGQGFLPQPWSTLINDYGGIALALLSATGLLFWWLPRRWRGHKPQGALNRRRELLRWLYRGHGPTVGVLAIVPILYVSITGIAADHIADLLGPRTNVAVPRAALPPLYRYADLTHEVSAVVAFPGEPERLLVASRFGPLESRDGGRTWSRDRSLGESGGTDAGRTALFRREDRVFVGIGGVGQFTRRDGESRWTELRLDGPRLAITDAARRGEDWFVKNSRAIYRGRLDPDPAAPAERPATMPFVDSGIAFPALAGTTAFLLLADIHSGNFIHSQWRWVNDIVAALAIVLAISGPILWWRRKWL
jgi:hypothetical protein